MQLATWNLERLGFPRRRDTAPIRAHTERVHADVWVFTETIEDLSPGTGYQGVSTTSYDREQAPDEVWTKIWSRWPIERVESVSDPARCVAARIVHPRRGPFIVYGTVLPWRGSTWRGLTDAGGVAFGAALEAQAADCLALRAAYPEEDLLVIGDLNQQLGVGAPWFYGSKPNEQRLREVFARLGLIAFTEGDNDPVRRDSHPMASIDHIGGPERWASRVRQATRWPDAPAPISGLSDHFGVAVELDFDGPSSE